MSKLSTEKKLVLLDLAVITIWAVLSAGETMVKSERPFWWAIALVFVLMSAWKVWNYIWTVEEEDYPDDLR